MKKMIFAFFLIFVAFSVFAQNGVVRELSGTVELKAAGASAFAPASVGDRVAQSTVISTGFKSTALLEIGSTLIAVRPLTRLTLTEIQSSAGAETLNVNLAAGRVRVDVNPPAGTRASMSVTTPSATASVRGTSFYVDWLNLKNFKGLIEYEGTDWYSYLVAAGFDSFAGDDPYQTFLASLQPKPPIGKGAILGNDDDQPEPTSNSTGPEGTVSVGLRY